MLVNPDRRTSVMKTGMRRIVLVVGVMIASACAGSPTSVPGEAGDARDASAAESGFALKADIIGDGALSLDDALVAGPVALWFWAPG